MSGNNAGTTEQHAVEFDYLDIYWKLRRDIEAQIYPPGSKLPAEGRLATQYQVKRFVVRKTILKLIADGFVYPIRNKGYYVLAKEIDIRIRKDTNYTQNMLDRKMVPKVKVLAMRIVGPSQEQRELFGLSDTDWVWELQVLRYHKNIPYIIGKSYIPVARFPEFGPHYRSMLSIFRVFREVYKVKPSRKSSVCKAVVSDKTESRLLSVFDNSPLLKVTSINVDQCNQPIEYCISTFRSDLVSVSINLQ